MKALYEQYPDDADAAVLYAESLMNLRPWQLWTADGKPAEGTEEIVRVLEAALKLDPNHPGANHYYIHATEASPNAGRALPSAERLKTIAPAAARGSATSRGAAAGATTRSRPPASPRSTRT